MILNPYKGEPIGRDRFLFDNVNFCNLRVVVKQSGMLKGVLRAFQQVVQIPPPRIGRIKLSIKFYRAGERRLWIVPEHRHDVFSVLTPFAAYQNFATDMAIIVIHRRWPGDFKLPDH